MNSIDKLYETFGKKFCVCPFLGGFYQSHHVLPESSGAAPSTLVPCSLTSWDRRDGTFNLVDNEIVKSMNTEKWKNLRRAFINGEYESLPECKICSDTERQGGDPARLGANLHYVQHCDSDIVESINTIISNDFTVDHVLSLDWYPSNYCNYSCVMCSGGASTGRMSFELKILRQKNRVVINPVSEDFYDVIRRVEIINFTGGETVMQSQVHDMIDYLVDNDLAANKTIFLLTNASSYPSDLESKFRKFRRVIYMCSLDGTGSVIEYQRRGAVWSEVEHNALRLLKSDFFSTVGNLVLTAINIFNIGDFVDWLRDHKITNGISVSPVFRVEYLGVESLPPRLRELAVSRLSEKIAQYTAYQDDPGKNGLRILESVKKIIDSKPFDQESFFKFRQHIAQEDSASVRPLVDCVPEWKGYL